VLDVDSDKLNDFSADDAEGLGSITAIIERSVAAAAAGNK
jgi:putative methionine-R-sulfoxide reductase with GAF domain